jgi:hypothetical protein
MRRNAEVVMRAPDDGGCGLENPFELLPGDLHAGDRLTALSSLHVVLDDVGRDRSAAGAGQHGSDPQQDVERNVAVLTDFVANRLGL